MPFRTRDFLLFLLTVAFLVVGITATVQGDIAKRTSSSTFSALVVSSEEVTYEAVLPETTDINRSGRLAALREKIAALVLVTPAKTEVEVVPEETVEEEVVTAGAVLYCPRYAAITPDWVPTGLQFEVVEGARLLYREIAAVPAATENSSGTMPTITATKDVVIQLPLRSAPLTTKTCLATDVIGVAMDGSLIRNNEQALYRVFGPETLIGYALDGFPIYGMSTAVTDECGGTAASGEYRYYLHSDRDGVLGCFGGVPVAL